MGPWGWLWRKKKRTRGPADPTCVESPAALLCVTHRLRQPQHGPPVHAKTSAAGPAPSRTFTRQPPTQRPTTVRWNANASHRLVFFFSLFFFDSETVKEGQARCQPSHSPQVFVGPSVHRASLLSPAAEQTALACHARDGVQSQASVNKAGRVSPEMLLPGAKPACRTDGISSASCGRNASMRPTPESVLALALARPPKLKPGDTEWSTLNNGVFFHIQPASVPYRILSKAVN